MEISGLQLPCNLQDIPHQLKSQFRHFAGYQDDSSLNPFLHVARADKETWDLVQEVYAKYQRFELNGQTLRKVQKQNKSAEATVKNGPSQPFPFTVHMFF